MTKVKTDIAMKTIKPKLSVVAPLVNANVNVFIWLNLLVAYSFYVQAPNHGLLVANSYIFSYLWTAVFIILSILLTLGKLINNWQLTRWVLVVALFLKTIITYALVVLAIKSFNGIIGILGLWLAITALQFSTVRYMRIPGEKYVK